MASILDQSTTLNGNAVDLIQAEVQRDYDTAAGRAKLTMHTLPGGVVVNSPMDVRLGYAGNVQQLLTGYIDSITKSDPGGLVVVEGRDVIKRALNFLMTPANPQEPVKSYNNTPANVIVGDMLADCGLTNYSGDACAFSFGVQCPAEFSIATVWDQISLINSIIVWHCWAEPSGQVRFADLRPVPVGAPIASFVDGSNILSVSYSRKDDNLRNRVVVFGRTLDDGTTIQAEASASSPYVPDGYPRTAVVSSQLIDTQEMAQGAADYNLAAWNKLDEAVDLTAIGNPQVTCNDTVTISETFTGVSGDWFVASVVHLWGPDTYTMRITATR
jgi:hypothetical protein